MLPTFFMGNWGAAPEQYLVTIESRRIVNRSPSPGLSYQIYVIEHIIGMLTGIYIVHIDHSPPPLLILIFSPDGRGVGGTIELHIIYPYTNYKLFRHPDISTNDVFKSYYVTWMQTALKKTVKVLLDHCCLILNGYAQIS